MLLPVMCLSVLFCNNIFWRVWLLSGLSLLSWQFQKFVRFLTDHRASWCPHNTQPKGSVKGFKNGGALLKGINVFIWWHGSGVFWGSCVCAHTRVYPVHPHRWADCCLQVPISSITLHSLSVQVQVLSLGRPPPTPQRQPIRGQEQRNGRAAMLSAGLMPTKVYRCRHSVA